MLACGPAASSGTRDLRPLSRCSGMTVWYARLFGAGEAVEHLEVPCDAADLAEPAHVCGFEPPVQSGVLGLLGSEDTLDVRFLYFV